jgi:uncharacterized membrane protein
MEENLKIFYKAITWRFVATIITFFIAWIITGTAEIALGIAWLDTIIKILAYMGHEKVWQKI